MRCSWSE